MQTKHNWFWFFLAKNWFSCPNSQFLPIACYSIFWKLLASRLIWFMWRPSTCIVWPVRFFVILWEWTGSISGNLVVTKSLLNFGFLPLNRKYRGFPGLHGNRNNRNGGTKKGEVDISPEFIADVDWTHKLFSLQTSNHGNLEICWKRPLTAWSQVWWRIFLFVQLLGVFGTFWTF